MKNSIYLEDEERLNEIKRKYEEDRRLSRFIEYCVEKDKLNISMMLSQETGQQKQQLNLLSNLVGVVEASVNRDQQNSNTKKIKKIEMNVWLKQMMLTRIDDSILQQMVNYWSDEQNQQYNQTMLGYLKQNKTDQISVVSDNYNRMINSQAMVMKRSYRFHNEGRKQQWTQQMFISFMEGLLKYMGLTINNRKIAGYMGGSVRANHVKYVKGVFIRRLKKKAKANKRLLKDQLQIEIQTFDKTDYQDIVDII